MNENRGQRTKDILEKRKIRKQRQLDHDLTSLKFTDLAKAKKAERKYKR